MGLTSADDSSSPVCHDLRIVLLGKTGSGKSATGNTILGRKAFTADFSPSSVTKTCKKEISLHDQRTVSVVDTPGVFDTSITDVELKNEIEKCIKLSIPGPHLFLLVIRLDVRFTGEEKKAVEWIKDNFGGEASKYTLVLFTRGDLLGLKSIETFLEESAELKELIRSCNGRYSVFDNTCMSNRTQVNDLFEKIDEIVQLNGNHYTSSIYEAVQKKMKSDEWWSKCGGYMDTAGNQLMIAAAATAVPVAGGAIAGGPVAAEIATAVSMRSMVMFAGAGISKAIGRWIKPKTKDNSSSPVCHDLRIVLLGKTGSGKSATGNTILGREAFAADFSPSSVTKTCRKEISHHDQRTVSVVDTPGVFDTSITDVELKNEIEKCIKLSIPGPHLFLLVIRLDVRFTGEEKKAVEWIKDNFGGEASKYTLVLFTRGDLLRPKSIETFLEESSELSELIRSCNGRYSVFDNTCMSSRTQVNDLFEKIDKIVQLNGNHYTSSIYEAAQKKMKSDEWWSKCGGHMDTLAIGLIGAAAATAVPVAGAAVVAEEAALTIGPSLLLAGAGISKAIGRWMKPKTEGNSSSPVCHDLRIVLLGKTGSGKSATGNTILGRKAFTADFSPSSVTKTCKKEISLHDQRTVSVVDTPGVFDTSITDVELKNEIEKCIKLSIPGPHLFLLVIRLDVRFTGEEKKAVEWIKDNFGGEASKYTLVLFTRGDLLGLKSIETFLAESSELRELIKSCNGRYSVFDNTCMSNRTQVNDLFEKIDEIVQLNGNHYTSSIYEAAQKKMKSDEWWSKCGGYMDTLGNQLMYVALPVAGGAISGGVVAASMRAMVMFAGAGTSKVIGSWMKPKNS
uniref:GTPase IMAP family member 8-like n=1 Tax=Semicossyphus pulcher TaxID=241346 RepID=UPI0037E99A28